MLIKNIKVGTSMNIVYLKIAFLIITILGVLLPVIVFFVSYNVSKKRDEKGLKPEYVQSPLKNSDVSIKEAIKYLKIVNTAEDYKKTDE